jgi:hypothetical protein
MAMSGRARPTVAEHGLQHPRLRVAGIVATARDALARRHLVFPVAGVVGIGPEERARPFGQAAGEIKHALRRGAGGSRADRCGLPGLKSGIGMLAAGGSAPHDRVGRLCLAPPPPTLPRSAVARRAIGSSPARPATSPPRRGDCRNPPLRQSRKRTALRDAPAAHHDRPDPSPSDRYRPRSGSCGFERWPTAAPTRGSFGATSAGRDSAQSLSPPAEGCSPPPERVRPFVPVG